MLGPAKLIYRMALSLYQTGITLATPINPKAKAWVMGRKLQRKDPYKFPNGCIWVHCASLGEYEQGKPVIDALHRQYPATPLVVTFFSPSGYEVVKKRETPHNTLYLPMDSPGAAKRFMDLINPKLAVFIKYEYWYFYLAELNKREVPTYLVSALFRKDHIFFRPWGILQREMLRLFTHIFVQNEESAGLLKGININHVTVAGDTRFDRVLGIQQNPRELPVIERFTQNAFTLVAGSTWPEDEELLVKLINAYGDNPGIKFIVAPHEIKEAGILRLTMNIQPLTVLYSEGTKVSLSDARVLIVDSIGQLSHIYKYGQVAYVGGGFGKGIHNTLEAAAPGMPVIFGPEHQQFGEALGLLEHEAGFTIDTYEDLQTVFHNLVNNTPHLNAAGTAAREFVEQQTGATEKIMDRISQEVIL